jgi:TolB-like protein
LLSKSLGYPRPVNGIHQPNFLERLRRRGVLRVAIGYAVIGWLLLQIGDVVLEPLDAPDWLMRALIVAIVAGFPVALALAWFLELGPSGVTVDLLPEGAERPTVTGIRRYADLVIIVVLLAVIAVLLARQEGLIETEAEQPVLAILPFEEIGNEDGGYFGAGLADTLSTKLGELQQLIVLASASTREFRGTGLDLADVGADLGATALLLGTVQRAAGTLRVTTRLVDPRSGRQLWSGTYDRSAGDVFAVQDDIALEVTRSLALVLTPPQSERLVQQPTTNLNAYDTYLRAMDDLASREGPRIRSGLGLLREAVALDPEYALAQAGLAHALCLIPSYIHYEYPWSQVRDEARQAAESALRLDPMLGEAWFAKAMVKLCDQQFQVTGEVSREELEELLEKALELSPSNSAIMKQLASIRGDGAAAIELLRQAARIEPGSAVIRVNIAENYIELGDLDNAEQWLFSALKVQQPMLRGAVQVLMQLNMNAPGRAARAARWAQALYRNDPASWYVVFDRVRILNELGLWTESGQSLHEFAVHVEKQTPTSFAYLVGTIHLHLSQGNYAAATKVAEDFTREFMMPHASWPRLSEFADNWLVGLGAQALLDIENGNPEVALQRYLNGFAEPAQAAFGNTTHHTLRTPVMIALLYRLSGDEAAAVKLLQQLRERLDGLGSSLSEDDRVIGLTRFTVEALLGNTEAALVALQAAMDQGWPWQWWGLKTAAKFDANYAAVVADPRFEQLYAQIQQRVTEARESFLADPDLPEETLRAAGLDPAAIRSAP